jgi:hypothetical protein
VAPEEEWRKALEIHDKDKFAHGERIHDERNATGVQMLKLSSELSANAARDDRQDAFLNQIKGVLIFLSVLSGASSIVAVYELVKH